MLNSIIEIIKDWPIIVQGALGSGLFWLLLLCAQKTTKFMGDNFSKINKESELSALRTELLKIQMIETNGIDKLNFAAPIIYRMSRPFLKSMIWLVLGLLLDSTLPIFGVIGYIGSLVYLSKALNIVSPYKKIVDLQNRKSIVMDRINKLEDN